jgi:hypothetical protein
MSGLGTGVVVGVGVTVGARVGVADATGEETTVVAVAADWAGCSLNEANEMINNTVPSTASPAAIRIPVRRDMRAIVAQRSQVLPIWIVGMWFPCLKYANIHTIDDDRPWNPQTEYGHVIPCYSAW